MEGNKGVLSEVCSLISIRNLAIAIAGFFFISSALNSSRSVVRKHLVYDFGNHLLEFVDELLGIVAMCFNLAKALLPNTCELGAFE